MTIAVYKVALLSRHFSAHRLGNEAALIQRHVDALLAWRGGTRGHWHAEAQLLHHRAALHARNTKTDVY